MEQLSASCTVEDILTFVKKDIHDYLRSNQQNLQQERVITSNLYSHGMSDNDEQDRYANIDDPYKVRDIKFVDDPYKAPLRSEKKYLTPKKTIAPPL